MHSRPCPPAPNPQAQRPGGHGVSAHVQRQQKKENKRWHIKTINRFSNNWSEN